MPLRSLLIAIAAACIAAPAAGEESPLLAPIARITREELLETAYTGMGVAAALTRKATAIVDVTDTTLMLLDAAEAGIDTGDELLRERLLIITANREVLEQLREKGRLRAGDPAYETVRRALERESKLVFPSSGAFFERVVTSREGLTAIGRVSLEHGLRSFLGDRIVARFAPGTRVRSLIRTYASRDRALPRATWKRADRIARVLATITDEMTALAAEKAAESAQEQGGGGVSPCGSTTIGGGPRLITGPLGMMNLVQDPGMRVYIPCVADRPVIQPQAAVAVPRVTVVGRTEAVPTTVTLNPVPRVTERAVIPTIARPVVQVPVLLPEAVVGAPAPSRGSIHVPLGRAYNDAFVRQFGNWRE